MLQCTEVDTLQRLRVRVDDIRSLLTDLVNGCLNVEPRYVGKHTRIDDAEASSSANLELRIQDCHRIIVRSDRAAARSMVAPRSVFGPLLQLVFGLIFRAWNELRQGCVCQLFVFCEDLARELQTLHHSFEIIFPIPAAGIEVVEVDVRDIARVIRSQCHRTRTVLCVSFQDLFIRLVPSGRKTISEDIVTDRPCP